MAHPGWSAVTGDVARPGTIGPTISWRDGDQTWHMDSEQSDWARIGSRIGRKWLLPLALASIGGFVIWAGSMFLYDAGGGQGPLAGLAGSPIVPWAFRFFVLVLGPLIYAVATWRHNLRGAFVALGGVGLIGPFLFLNSPWQTLDPEGRYGYYDEGRGWVEFGLLIYGVGWVLFIPAITVITRAFWPRLRPLVRS
jgi:hypothetical protein